jgi:pentatricopeptide repeat protein
MFVKIAFASKIFRTRFEMLAYVLADDGKAEEAFRLLDLIKSRNQDIYHAVIASACRKSRRAFALKVLETMLERGITPNVESFNSLISMQDDINVAWKFFERIKSLRIDPTTVTFNSLINVMSRSSKSVQKSDHLDGDAIANFFELMKQHGIRPDARSYNTFIAHFSRNGDVASCISWMMKMSAAKVQPTTVTYNIILDACAKVGDVTTAQTFFNEMLSKHASGNNSCRPDAGTYWNIVHVYCKAAKPKESLEYVEKMFEANFTPDAIVLTTVVRAFGKCNDGTGARQVFEDMVGRGVVVDSICVGSVVDAISKSGDVVGAKEFLASWQARARDSSKSSSASSTNSPNTASDSSSDTCSESSAVDVSENHSGAKSDTKTQYVAPSGFDPVLQANRVAEHGSQGSLDADSNI